jgi:exportin-T
MASSSHLANIPQAVQIAASTGSSVDQELKGQALEYLNKVKELCDETWQVSYNDSPAKVRTA